MKRPPIEEFKRLTSQPAHTWGMADLDVIHLCDYILHLEAQNAVMRRTFGSDPIFNEKEAKIGQLSACLAEIRIYASQLNLGLTKSAILRAVEAGIGPTSES